MKILVIGAAGMVGCKLPSHLVKTGQLNDQTIAGLDLVDIVEPQVPDVDPEFAIEVQTRAVDMTQNGVADTLKLIKRKPDATIRAIVANWPENFDAQRATALGFEAETSFDEIIQVYLDDEMT